jgi:uncharacterized repeat protein (TIGR03806 family)
MHRFARTSFILALGLTSIQYGCGGGGGSEPRVLEVDDPPTPPAQPFGLSTRESVAPLNLIGSGGGLGSYDLMPSFPGLQFPSALFLSGVPGSGRLVVVQQSGFVRAFDPSPTVNQSRLILDLSSRIVFSGERGLLGLAFDPNFQLNRFLYVHYSASSPARSIIARFTWDPGPDSVDPASEKVVLELAQPYSNHNGGMLAFGPDDFLYIAFGDGGSGGDPQNNAQDTANLLGSLLRIDVHPSDPSDAYDIPLSNPFVGQAGFKGEIYAYGLRNPFRFSFDRNTGDLWLGDVGQNSIEEIDLIEAGGNYGWRVFEGSAPFDDSASTLPLSAFTAPVHEYDHSAGFAVIGGYVYRGSRTPTLQGRYLYGDFVTDTLWALDYDRANGIVLGNEVVATANSPASFGEDLAGEVYVVTDDGIMHLEETAGSGTGTEPPELLSDTGLFRTLTDLEPVSGFIEYTVRQSFWSDHAFKRRWIAVPGGEEIGFSSTASWQFPIGTVIVKHFELELIEGDPLSRRRMETRVLTNVDTGWRGFTYRWNDAQTDAVLLTGREQQLIDIELVDGSFRQQLYEYPSRTDCQACHTEAGGFVLGIRTRQLNGDFGYPAAVDNQLRSWNHVDLFAADIGAPSQYQSFSPIAETAVPIRDRSRSYLEINCAQCHQPGGSTPSAMDLRSDTPLDSMGVIDILPSAGDLGVAGARLVVAGDRSRSLLYLRMLRLDSERMPPIASHVVDQAGADLVGEWIDGL